MDCIDLFKRAAVALQTDPRYLALDHFSTVNFREVSTPQEVNTSSAWW